MLALKEQNGLKHKTVTRYHELMERIDIGIGHMKLTDIRPQHLNNFYQKILQCGERKDGKKATATESFLKLLDSNSYKNTYLSKLSGLSASTIGAIRSNQSVNLNSAEALAVALNLNVNDSFDIIIENDRLSPKTVLEHHRLIRAIFSQAEKEMLIPFNPASRASPPKGENKEANYFDENIIIAIREALEQEPLKWKVAVSLLLLSGCRRGEILGLKWNKVDFDNNQIVISSNLLYTKERGVYEDSTKTSKSNRKVKLTSKTMELLRTYKLFCTEKFSNMGYEFSEDDFLFTQRHNKRPMAPDSLTDYCNRLSKKYQLPHINPHAFRHSHISLLILNGVDIITASRRAGHSSVTTTVNTYGHVMQKADENAAEIFANFISTNNKKDDTL